jgi:hypothetical protein
MTLLRLITTVVLLSSTPLLAMDELEKENIVFFKPTMPQKLTYEMLKNINNVGFLSTLKGHYVFSVKDEDKDKNQYSPSRLLEIFHSPENFNILVSNTCLESLGYLTFYLKKYYDNFNLIFTPTRDFMEKDRPKNLEFRGHTREYILILTKKDKYLDLENVKFGFNSKKKKRCSIF